MTVSKHSLGVIGPDQEFIAMNSFSVARKDESLFKTAPELEEGSLHSRGASKLALPRVLGRTPLAPMEA
jgi:hypothetical protein